MNCKPGDLAYIIHAMCPQNVGRVVEVVRDAGDHWLLGHMWVVRAFSPLQVMTDRGGYTFQSEFADTPDAWLRPIAGLPVEAEEGAEVLA